MNASADTFAARPNDTIRSYELVWKRNTPVVRPSNWAPGYTPGHFASVDEAIKGGLARLTQEIADVREKWVALNAMAMSVMASDMNQDTVDPANDEQVDHGGFEDH
jgi:hypothetical protein